MDQAQQSERLMIHLQQNLHNFDNSLLLPNTLVCSNCVNVKLLAWVCLQGGKLQKLAAYLTGGGRSVIGQG